MDRSLGLVAVQARGGAVTIPPRTAALRPDAPAPRSRPSSGNDLLLIPRVAVPLQQMRTRPDDRAQTGGQTQPESERVAGNRREYLEVPALSLSQAGRLSQPAVLS